MVIDPGEHVVEPFGRRLLGFVRVGEKLLTYLTFVRCIADETDTVFERGPNECRWSASEVDHVHVVRSEFDRQVSTEPQKNVDISGIARFESVENDSDIDVTLFVTLAACVRAEKKTKPDWIVGEYGRDSLPEIFPAWPRHERQYACLG